jgi:hypothetical protein
MTYLGSRTEVSLRNIPFATDFSPSSEAALPSVLLYRKFIALAPDEEMVNRRFISTGEESNSKSPAKVGK